MSFRAAIRNHTKVVSLPGLPDSFRMHLITPTEALYTSRVEDNPFPSDGGPWWAFCWPGSYALARYMLETPEVMIGRRVFDLASGCGISAMAAVVAGASTVTANDIDSVALEATAMNCEQSGVDLAKVTLDERNWIGSSAEDFVGAGYDVLLAGDICYDKALASEVLSWLRSILAYRRNGEGVRVLIGDPGRHALPVESLVPIARYPLPPLLLDGNVGLTEGIVWELKN